MMRGFVRVNTYPFLPLPGKLFSVKLLEKTFVFQTLEQGDIEKLAGLSSFEMGIGLAQILDVVLDRLFFRKRPRRNRAQQIGSNHHADVAGRLHEVTLGGLTSGFQVES